MKVGSIITPNIKGQIVIPKEMRQALGINEKVALNVFLAGGAIHIYPVDEVVTKGENKSSYIELLKKTQGILGSAPYYKNERARRRLELAAAKRRKQW